MELFLTSFLPCKTGAFKVWSSLQVICTHAHNHTQGSAFVVVNLKVNVFDEENEAVNKLKKTMMEVAEGIGEMSRALPLYKLYPTKAYRTYVSAMKNLRSVGMVKARE